MNKIKFKINIGDWSNDGHGKCESFLFETNHPLAKLQKAYKDSCKATGVQFNHNENYIGKKKDDWRFICTEYEDGEIEPRAQKILSDHKILNRWYGEEGWKSDTNHREAFACLIMDFIGLTMPNDFEWKIIKEETPSLNGYWNKNLNVQFGYGCF